MIREEYIQFETAKLLKDAGFPQDIKQTMFYNKFGQDWHMGDHHWTNGFAKPSQAQAMRWLREQHGICVSVYPAPCAETERESFCYRIDRWDEECEFWSTDFHHVETTYEEAIEAAIQEVCKYLIKKGGKQ